MVHGSDGLIVFCAVQNCTRRARSHPQIREERPGPSNLARGQTQDKDHKENRQRRQIQTERISRPPSCDLSRVKTTTLTVGTRRYLSPFARYSSNSLLAEAVVLAKAKVKFPIMHMALPTRKPSNPRPYTPRSRTLPMLRRSRVQVIVLGLCALATFLFTISRILGSSERIPSGTPPVVIVTVLDEHYSTEYLQTIKENRNAYAKEHGEWDWG